MISVAMSFIMLLVGLALLLMIGTVVLYILAAVSVVCLIVSIVRYIQVRGCTGTEFKCPYCGSTNVKFGSVNGGSVGTVVLDVYMSHNYRKRILRCLDCGYDYDYYSDEEVEAGKRSRRRHVLFWLVATAALAVVIL